MIKQFEAGKSYKTRSIVDSDSWFGVKIISRTEKSVKVKRDDGEIKLCRVNIWCNVETIKPWGSYSMCPIISAEKAS